MIEALFVLYVTDAYNLFWRVKLLSWRLGGCSHVVCADSCFLGCKFPKTWVYLESKLCINYQRGTIFILIPLVISGKTQTCVLSWMAANPLWEDIYLVEIWWSCQIHLVGNFIKHALLDCRIQLLIWLLNRRLSRFLLLSAYLSESNRNGEGTSACNFKDLFPFKGLNWMWVDSKLVVILAKLS